LLDFARGGPWGRATMAAACGRRGDRILRNKDRYLLILGASAWALGAVPAFAAGADPAGGDGAAAPADPADPATDATNDSGDIVVTAERRETSLQKTPLAISALGADALQEQRLQVLRDLAAEVPSLVTPGMHANMQSVYIPRTFGNGLFDLPDIERVEVLRGPQGTLYGLNTSAGAIKFVSRDPGNETIGHVDLGLGSYDAFEGHAYVSGPIVADRLSASIAYTHRRRDGYIDNLTLGRDVDRVASDQFRAKLRWTPAGPGGFEAVLSVDGTRERSDNASYVPVDYPGWGPYTSFGNVDQSLRRNIGGAALRLTLPLSDAITLKSITAYRGFEDDPSPWDQDATPSQTYGWTQYIDQRQFSQELQALGDIGRLTFVVGLSYFRERLDFIRNSFTNANYSLVDSHIIDKSLGLYGQATYALTDKLSVTAGLRLNKEWQRFDNAAYASNAANDRLALRYQVQGLKDDWTALTPKLSVNYQWSNLLLTYASFTRGQKSGGFNRSASTAEIAEFAVNPEEVTAYEVGLKGRTADGLLRANIAAFYNQFSDYIASITNPQVNGQVILGNVVANAARAKTYGAEAELWLVPVRGFELRGSAAWLKTRFGSFANPTGAASSDYTGNELPSAPRWVLAGSAGWTPEIAGVGELGLRARVRHQTQSFSDTANRLITAIPAHTVVDLTASFRPEGSRFSLSANVTNLFDTVYRVAGTINPALGVTTAAYNPPRMFLATLRFDL